MRSVYSPCGHYVVAGSEDGRAYLWDLGSQKILRTYKHLGFAEPVHAVAWHPWDHMIAFASFGRAQPIVVMRYDPNDPGAPGEVAETAAAVGPGGGGDDAAADARARLEYAVAERQRLKEQKLNLFMEDLLSSIRNDKENVHSLSVERYEAHGSPPPRHRTRRDRRGERSPGWAEISAAVAARSRQGGGGGELSVEDIARTFVQSTRAAAIDTRLEQVGAEIGTLERSLGEDAVAMAESDIRVDDGDHHRQGSRRGAGRRGVRRPERPSASREGGGGTRARTSKHLDALLSVKRRGGEGDDGEGGDEPPPTAAAPTIERASSPEPPPSERVPQFRSAESGGGDRGGKLSAADLEASISEAAAHPSPFLRKSLERVERWRTKRKQGGGGGDLDIDLIHSSLA